MSAPITKADREAAADGQDGIAYVGAFPCAHCNGTGTVKLSLTIEPLSKTQQFIGGIRPAVEVLHDAIDAANLTSCGDPECSECHRGAAVIEADRAQCLAALQTGVGEWMQACFGDEIARDLLERDDRCIEEMLELAQTNPAFTKDRAHALVEYVFNRPVGDPFQETGGVMVTLAARCNTAGIDMMEAGRTELARVWTKIEAIRAKQASKPAGSALPVAMDSPDLATKDAQIAALQAHADALAWALARCSEIVRRNNFRQNEKIDDVPLIAGPVLRDYEAFKAGEPT